MTHFLSQLVMFADRAGMVTDPDTAFSVMAQPYHLLFILGLA